MQPSKELVTTIATMFREIWDNRLKRFESKWKEQKHALSGLSTKINTLTDRLIDTTSPTLIKNYESKLEAMETEKALIAENMRKKPDMNQNFERSFRTAKTTSPFKALADIQDGKSEMAERKGIPNFYIK